MRRYRRNPQTAGRVVDGLAFVVTPDDNKLHTLNVAATRLWQAAQLGISADEAARLLVDAFEVETEVAAADATACLDDLVSRAILVVDEA